MAQRKPPARRGRRAAASEAAVQPAAPVLPDLTGIRRIEAPTFYVTTCTILAAGNDATLVFTRPAPAVMPDGSAAPVAISEPVVILQMSLHSLKDTAVLLGNQIPKIEEAVGPLETDYTRHQQQLKETPPSSKH
jgi:hypothetical protein